MLLIDLFDRDNILCPEWLSNEELDDEWQDSTYSFKDGYHTWCLEDIFGEKSRICFNGDEYHFQALNEEYEEWIPFETITKDGIIRY